MRAHLTEESLIDALDGTAGKASRDHLRECGACAERLRGLEEALGVAREAEVPEPSPLFWAAFRRQLGRRVGRPQASPWRFAFWPSLLATAALLLAALGVLSSGPRETAAPGSASAPWTALPPLAEDAAIPALEGALASLDDDLPLAQCGDMTACLAGLSDDERRLLAESVARELSGRKS
jgi:hypothetical protein